MSTPDAPDPQAPPPPPPYGQPAPPPYGAYPPPYGYYPPPRPTNGMSIAALVCGIVGACSPLGILGLIFGTIAKRQIRETGEAGEGFATAGIVLGWIGVASIVFWVLYFIFWIGMMGTIFSNIPTDDWPTDDSTWDYSVVLTLLGLA
ncbi:DUF4190 domain-containing protein [Glycomyces terrestris]|uniref:DUF4190 domain-containing protein n=1 Tax=Glycomyces terrestris TaxID=2493553 RepID=A0A426V4M2_9ACTN|nr:DUF4190 domain-containing protein [Glycomyces terrestris]RRS01833.1 DUF4190 domain-containing protein [Glycomyces terrestris]